ncbi:stage III sporulation protein AB [Thermohalobacter berrensis]|uniref:Stage III sporulation protein AB n=2 Tax=Thermohalobacter berrensis TaxID=99594 RepID=A0A419TAR7_9FIRM|nr:stage III sporulation protein AB [Thermohalobacter berrensis]
MLFILKIIGSLMIVISCSFFGFYLGSRYSKRLNNLIFLQNCIQLLESEVIYSATPLPEALDNVYRKGNKKVSFIFKEIKDHLKSNKVYDIYDSFVYIKDILKNNLHLIDEDIEIILSLGRVLGSSNRDDQQKHFKLVLKQIQTQQKEAEEKKKKNEKLYKNLGVLTGLAIVIILL